MPEVQFLTNQAEKVEGLAYAGFETFKGSPYTSCARETGQNSRDAATANPVGVHFNLLVVPRAQVPFADQLEHSVKCCLKNPHDDKTKLHLERALKAISSPDIKVLQISDRNTTGLTGPTTDPRSVFAALVKGDGVTNKSDETSAGSFGIGKNAAFAVSDLQTVIYSTLYKDTRGGEGPTRFAAQGRLRLISHADGDKNLSAEGYWGLSNFKAIEDMAAIPSWMQRKEIGTSIFSVGFREQDHWIERMSLSLATNFFLAIHRREIEFSVGSSVHINHGSLSSTLNSSTLEQTAAAVDQLEDLRRARRLMECVESDIATHHEIEVPGLGDFTLHLLIKDGTPREVHVLRNGIYISDNFAKFSEPMRKFPGVREFIALLEPSTQKNGKGPSALLKQLENPAHDAFEPERIVDEHLRGKAKIQIKSLVKKVREIIRANAKIEDLNSSHLDELSHLFADSGAGTKADQEEDPGRFVYGEARRGRRAPPPGAHRGKDGRGDGGGHREKSGTKSAGKQHPAAALRGLRSTLPNPSDVRRRKIFFTPDCDGEIKFAVAAVGLSGDVTLPVESSTFGEAADGYVTLPVTKGARMELEVTLVDPYPGPIELAVSHVKTGES
ncbi:MAG: hypothetical protein Q7K57_59865 [Burkholderiaceae bacterium]|nr:hypothetical protein [Polaromonas sp.]MDO8778621.1 hypothetical protein [Burkholderiaceae bacterium]